MRRRIGRRSPPREGLIGRTQACRILQCDKRTLRRMERDCIVKPALVEPDGVRWFDIEAIRLIAAAMQRGVSVYAKRPRRRVLPPGVERCTGAETAQINDWIAAGLDHAEIVSRSGKSNETIRYLYAQFITPHGRRLRKFPLDASREEPYYPELRPTAPQARPAPGAPARFEPAPRGSQRANARVPAEWFRDVPTAPDSPGVAKPIPPRLEVPADWFDDDKPDGARRGNNG
jgi:hypothetical protein